MGWVLETTLILLLLLSKNSIEMSQSGLILYINVLNEDNFEKEIKLDFNLFEKNSRFFLDRKYY